MTNPGLTDLLAAHTFDSVGRICSCGVLCGVVCDNLTYPAHVALVVEQHTNGRMAELEADIAYRQKCAETIGALHAKVCDDVAKAVGVEIDPNGDADWAGVFEMLAELGARVEKAEVEVIGATVAVGLAAAHRFDFDNTSIVGPGGKVGGPNNFYNGVVYATNLIRAALEGEQR